MKITRLSASSIKNYRKCEMLYFIDQVLGIRLESPFPGTHIGTITHKNLELIAKGVKAKQNNKNYHESKVFGKIDVDNIDLEKLFDKVYYHYIGKIKIDYEWADSDRKKCQQLTWKALKHQNGLYSPLNRHILGVEKRFGIEIKKNWAKLDNEKFFKLSGVIDLIAKVDGDDDTIEIIDWKTSKYTKDFDTNKEIDYFSLQSDIQLLIYYYAAKELFGKEKNILTTIFFLNNKLGPQTLHLGEDIVGPTEDKIRRQFEIIKYNNNPQPNYSWFCHKVCNYGRSTFAELEQKPLEKFWKEGVAKYGEPCKICDEIKFNIDKFGLEETENRYGRKT